MAMKLYYQLSSKSDEKNQNNSRPMLLLGKSATFVQRFIKFSPPIFLEKRTKTHLLVLLTDKNLDKAFLSSLVAYAM